MYIVTMYDDDDNVVAANEFHDWWSAIRFMGIACHYKEYVMATSYELRSA